MNTSSQSQIAHEAAIAHAAALRARVYAEECRCRRIQGGCLNWLKIASEWELLAASLEAQMGSMDASVPA